MTDSVQGLAGSEQFGGGMNMGGDYVTGAPVVGVLFVGGSKCRSTCSVYIVLHRGVRTKVICLILLTNCLNLTHFRI